MESPTIAHDAPIAGDVLTTLSINSAWRPWVSHALIDFYHKHRRRLIKENQQVSTIDAFDSNFADLITDLYTSEDIQPVSVTYSVIEHREDLGVDGGGTVADVWTQRPYNWLYGDVTHVSLSNGIFTLGNGIYVLDCDAHVYGGNYSEMRLYSITSDEPIYDGATSWAKTGDVISLRTMLFVSISGQYEIQHLSNYTHPTIGLGRSRHIGAHEIYSTLGILRIGDF